MKTYPEIIAESLTALNTFSDERRMIEEASEQKFLKILKATGGKFPEDDQMRDKFAETMKKAGIKNADQLEDAVESANINLSTKVRENEKALKTKGTLQDVANSARANSPGLSTFLAIVAAAIEDGDLEDWSIPGLDV